MSAFATLLIRDVRLAFRAGGNAALSLGFFVAVAVLMPLGIGSDPALLARIAGGVIWVSAVLAALLGLDRLFQPDLDDGTLDLLAMGPLPLEGIATAKAASHWLTTGLPLTLLSPVLALLLALPARAIGTLVLSLVIGTPALSAMGSIVAAVTLSVRRGGLLLPLIVLPLIVPAVVFGAGAVLAAMDGIASGALWLLAAYSFVAVVLSPFAAGAALRFALSE